MAKLRTLPNSPSVVAYGSHKYVLTDAPSNSNIDLYIQFFQKHNVTDVVRVCAPSYSKNPVLEAGMKFHDWPFTDGSGPPDEIIDQWFDLVENTFSQTEEKKCIAVHCVAGLGRAPVLVALALVEFHNLSPLDAIEFIRERRRGAINAKQLDFIEAYKPRRRGASCSPCVLL